MTVEQAIEILQAAKAGKKIEFREKETEHWYWYDYTSSINFNFQSFEYRIALEPKVIWVNEYSDGSLIAHFDKEKVMQYPNWGSLRKRAVKYIEVIE